MTSTPVEGQRWIFTRCSIKFLALLRSRGRVTYGALKRQFNLDDAFLDDLKAEISKGQWLAADEDGEVLVWNGDATLSPPSETMAQQAQGPSPLTYTPSHLAEKIRTVRPTLEGERKQVTVLFADLKGSTELIQGLDPEAAQQLLDPAIQRMMDAVHRFEGTVNQVLGDGIMALFGAPLAHEDHALRACYAALAMQVAMRAYTEEVRHRQGIDASRNSACVRYKRTATATLAPYTLRQASGSRLVPSCPQPLTSIAPWT
jgi:hypothetical protein